MPDALATPMPEGPPVAHIGGLGRRLVAALIDAALLGGVGQLLGTFVGPALAPPGSAGRLLGLALVLPYFALLESDAGGGQSLGKRAVGLRVVGAEGRALAVPRAFGRSAVAHVPWFLNGLMLPAAWVVGGPGAFVLALVTSTAVFGICGADVGLLLLNRRTRQTVHDLVSRSYVVAAGDAGRPVPVVTSRRARWAAAAWILAVPAAVTIASPLLQGARERILPARLAHELYAIPGVRSVSVSQTVVHARGGSTPIVQATLWYAGADSAIPAVRAAAAAALLRHQPAARDAEQVGIVVVQGWDVGVASRWRSTVERRAPGEWERAAR